MQDSTNFPKTISEVRPVSELPSRYRALFPYMCFNHVQSMVFDSVMTTDCPIVVSAPTGSGKTGVLELAIVKMLWECQKADLPYNSYKVVYLAPTKALCSEKKEDWSKRFAYLNVKCLELTSDYPTASTFNNLQQATIILATPEKWDSITRNSFGHRQTISSTRLILIDEVHLVHETYRGATLEAVVSRMKTIRSLIWPEHQENMRLVAISATVSNIEDFGLWFSTPTVKTKVFKVDQNVRPVKLTTVVLGYSCKETTNDFAFDGQLSHKIPEVIKEYSSNKQTLIFCATRRFCLTTATYLVREGRLDLSYMYEKRKYYHLISSRCIDKNLQEVTRFGIAFHHAGLQTSDRKLIEQAFLDGHVMVLCSTSTLALGINLPAHLVIIKNTNFYTGANFAPYSESSLVQMIGRAGRPQFDTEATAVLMTKSSEKNNIQRLLSGNLVVESQLHKYLLEHLNSEIVLGTIKNEVIARKWLESTFLRVRLDKCPENYGLSKGCSPVMRESALINWVNGALQKLVDHDLVIYTKNNQIESTDAGRAMARHYVCFDTMIKITKFKGDESMLDLLNIICSCYEVVSDMTVRLEEKSALNSLNNNSSPKKLRFPVGEKINTKEKKALLLIEAVLGNININEVMLNQESIRVTKNASRVVSCLRDVILLINDIKYEVMLNILLLHESFEANLWENSPYVAKQLDKIGNTLSQRLADNGLTTFESIRKANPRNIEILCGKLPPFGSKVQQTCCALPIYQVNLRFRACQNNESQVLLIADIKLDNGQELRHVKTLSDAHECIFLVGNKQSNKILFKSYVTDMHLLARPDLTQTFGKEIDKIHMPTNFGFVEAYLISPKYVGLNVCVQVKYQEPVYNGYA